MRIDKILLKMHKLKNRINIILIKGGGGGEY